MSFLARLLMFRLLALATPLLATLSVAMASEAAISGPIAAEVVKVRDGDTVEVTAHIWPQQTVAVAVRLRGIDAPEISGKCPAEKQAAEVAKARLVTLLAGGSVTLANVSGDKYFGRVLAEMSAEGEADVGAILLREGLVAPYQGKARRNWCDGA